jgi:hypothetical protein
MAAADVAGFATADLEARFRVTQLLPILLLSLLVALLVVAGAPAETPTLDRLVDHLDNDEWGLLLAVALASLFVALLLRPFQLQLVRVLEGYWPDNRATSVLAAHMRASQAAHKAELSARAALADPHMSEYLDEHLKRLEHRTDQCAAAHLRVARRWRGGPETRARLFDHARWYPTEERLLPTRLGNTLRSIEDNAGQRYGLSTVTIWPRLYPLLSDTLRQESQRARDDYDTAARLCAALAFLSVVSAGLVMPNGGWWRLTPVFWPASCQSPTAPLARALATTGSLSTLASTSIGSICSSGCVSRSPTGTVTRSDQMSSCRLSSSRRLLAQTCQRAMRRSTRFRRNAPRVARLGIHDAGRAGRGLQGPSCHGHPDRSRLDAPGL